MTTRYSVNLAGNVVLNDGWGYDPVGNLTSATDSAQGQFAYTYDNLNRVTNAVIPPFTETYGYDSWGNQTSRTLSEGTGYQWNYMPTTRNQASGMTYDAAGNTVSDGLHSYSYDAENRVTAVTDQGVTYRYDPEGQRVATISGGAVQSEYLYDMGGSLVTTVNGTGQMVRGILRDNGGLHWGDYVGSAGTGGVRTEFRLVNQVGTLVANGDAEGHFVEGCLSGPFGDGQLCTPGYDFTETHFTDKLRDAETDNDDFGARYFNSTLGRFMSPDYSATGDAPDPVPYADYTNPQSLNLYSYAYNNPLTNTDSDGHLPCGGSATINITVGGDGSSSESQTPDCPTPVNVGQMTQGAFTEVGNMFASVGNFLDQHLGNGQNQEAIQPIIGTNQQRGASIAGVGMFFIPGPEELRGIQLLSRDQLLGEITNPALRSAIGRLYREGAGVGDGSTAAAIEHELATGESVGGRFHSQKGRDSINELRRILRSQNLSPREQAIAQSILTRTESVLGLGGPE